MGGAASPSVSELTKVGSLLAIFVTLPQWRLVGLSCFSWQLLEVARQVASHGVPMNFLLVMGRHMLAVAGGMNK